MVRILARPTRPGANAELRDCFPNNLSGAPGQGSHPGSSPRATDADSEWVSLRASTLALTHPWAIADHHGPGGMPLRDRRPKRSSAAAHGKRCAARGRRESVEVKSGKTHVHETVGGEESPIPPGGAAEFTAVGCCESVLPERSSTFASQRMRLRLGPGYPNENRRLAGLSKRPAMQQRRDRITVSAGMSTEFPIWSAGEILPDVTRSHPIGKNVSSFVHLTDIPESLDRGNGSFPEGGYCKLINNVALRTWWFCLPALGAIRSSHKKTRHAGEVGA